jgi:alkylation response protein AidB-like acyl-CoA dehydrogenase
VFATKDARLHSRGISCFLVERSAPGVSVTEMKLQGLKGASLATLTLNDVGVDRANLIGRPNGGAQVFRQAMLQERILLSAFLVGSMRRALIRSSDYAKSRHQFGVPIATHQYVSGRIVEMLVRYATAKLLLDYAIKRLAAGAATEADASLVKLHASEAALECQLNAFRVHGGKGLEADGGNCDELIDVLSSLTYSGTSDLQKVILAASLGLPT